MKRHIPNFITLLNLLSGCIATVLVLKGNLSGAALFVFLGIFFDFFDGLVARKLNVQSELGLQLDSLADMVTSGLVPGLVMYQLLDITFRAWEYDVTTTVLADPLWIFSQSIYPYMGFLITLSSAYRLAKFNISDNQTSHFIGLPTPANALLILSLPLILEFQNNDLMNSIILNKWFLIGVTLVSTVLLNANIKLLALKFSNFSFKDNASRYLLLILAIVLLVIFHFAAIPLIILLYIILSLLNT